MPGFFAGGAAPTPPTNPSSDTRSAGRKKLNEMFGGGPNPNASRAGLGDQAAGIGNYGKNFWDYTTNLAQNQLGGAQGQAAKNAQTLNSPSAIEQYYQQLQGSGSQYFNNARADSMGKLSQLYTAGGAFGSGANLAANAKAQATLGAQEEQFMGGLANEATQAQQGRLGQAYSQQYGVGGKLADLQMQGGQGGISAWTSGQKDRIAGLMGQIQRGEAISDQDKQFVYSLFSGFANGAGQGFGKSLAGG